MSSLGLDLSEEDLQAIIDEVGSGTIDTNELGTVMRSLGLDYTEAELQAMIGEVNKDGNGTIDFTEFLLFMNLTMREVFDDLDNDGSGTINTKKELIDAIKMFDKYGSGTINTEELQEVMQI